MDDIMFTKAQQEVIRCANKRWNILSGATRSGKTHVSYFLVPKRIQEHYDHNITFVGKTITTLDRNIFDPMRKIYGNDVVGKMLDKKEIYIFGKRCYCVGANDDRAITKIQGLGLGYMYGDEITTWPENFFNMAKSRLDLASSKFDGTCNPENPSHFVKNHIDNKTLDIYSRHFTIYDNTFLSPEFIRNLENEYRGTIYFDRWILGKWVRTEGLVFPLFKRDKHYLTRQEYLAQHGNKNIVAVILGTDGATTNDATAIVPLAIMEDGTAAVLDIFYHNPKTAEPLANWQLVNLISEYFEDLEDKYGLIAGGANFVMPVDCASSDLTLTLFYHFPQYNPFAFTRKNLIDTTQTVNSALGRNIIIILDCGGTKNYYRQQFVSGINQLVIELESMTWSETEKNKFDDSIPNDAADAFRYAVSLYYQNPDNMWSTPSSQQFIII